MSPGMGADSVSQFGRISARSQAMRNALGLAARYAPADVTIALIGETGTGKDVLAHEIHSQSGRAQGDFVVFDCGAVAPNLAESELLGHERGAFTGAVAAHAGAFERARGGTLFLDEIGELPLDLQPKLLRAIENRKARRVGGSEDRPFDLRIVAATNRDLRTEVAEGKFRRDLYFRLGAAVIPVPPLRERLEDLPELVQALLQDLGRGDLYLPEEALTMLRFRSWPGNVRELKNTLACALTFIEPGECSIEARHLGEVFVEGMADDGEIERLPLGGQRLDRIERAAILQTLGQAGGNKVRAAQVLGIAVSTLYEKLKKYGQPEE
jgi:transcriptional regulator with PAS, ATPase and Fis domain